MDLFITNTQISFHKMLNDGLDTCGLLVEYCVVLSAVLDLILMAHSLQRIHWWASNLMLFLQICLDEETN